MEKQNIIIENLARMVQIGFNKTAGREQVKNLERWAKSRFDGVDKQLEIIRKQLTDVVYGREFRGLEVCVKELENLFAMNIKK